MRKWRQCALASVVAAAGTLFAAVPASAETAAEAPGATETATTEAAPPAATAPASTGWVPQGAGTEASSGGSAPTQRGASLGSGAASEQARSHSEQSAPTTASSDYYEPEPSTQPTYEDPPASPAPASPPQAKSAIDTVEPPPAKATTAGKDADVAVDAAALVALPESTHVKGISASSATVAPAASERLHESSSGAPLSLALLVVALCGLLLAYVVREEFHGRQPTPMGLVLKLSRRGRRDVPARRSG